MGLIWKLKDKLYFVIGGLLLFVGIVFDAAGGYMILRGEEGVGAFVLFFFTLILVLPAVLLIRHGFKLRKKQDKLEKLKLYLKRNNKIKVSKLANAVGENQLNTISLLEDGMDKGLFHGSYEEEDDIQYFKYSEYPTDSENYNT